MPQTAVGISLLTAAHCFEQADVRQAIRDLIKPIPANGTLDTRTRKAQAQHTHHGIGYQLTTSEVRNIERAGYVQILNFLEAALGMLGTTYRVGSYDPEGAWATPEIVQGIENVLKSLSPSKENVLRELLRAIKDAFELPEIKKRLHERKDLLLGWGDKDFFAQKSAFLRINHLTEEILLAVVGRVREKAGEIATPEGLEIAQNIIDRLDRMIPRV